MNVLSKPDLDWDREILYDPKFTYQVIRPTILRLHTAGNIGPVIVDIGSGNQAISDVLSFDVKLRRISIDPAGKFELGQRPPYRRHLQRTIEEFMKPSSVVRAEVKEVLNLLDLPQNTFSKPLVDTFILSQILSYVDCEEVLRFCARHLKVGGRVLIFSKPEKTDTPQLLHRNGHKSNRLLESLIRSAGMTVEESKIHDLREKEYRDASVPPDRLWIAVVAKKTHTLRV